MSGHVTSYPSTSILSRHTIQHNLYVIIRQSTFANKFIFNCFYWQTKDTNIQLFEFAVRHNSKTQVGSLDLRLTWRGKIRRREGQLLWRHGKASSFPVKWIWLAVNDCSKSLWISWGHILKLVSATKLLATCAIML